ncbi:zinc finger protein 628-like [Schistocerca serialis cubense]|uniref:zinc finger protein 628-like n=1 Tax=Schistocerca serialis cubense TaxID=2023355 RepID=UPI00214ED456|nr:zinc finger protein 628-like [Schistocerca serialis cubense]
MKIHRDQREYACTECGRRFNQRVAYNTHVRKHTGERPHRCTVCSETFYRKALLSQHMENHTKEKPLACLESGKCFSESSNKAQHESSLSGLPPYVSERCLCSSSQDHLCSHVACHAGTAPAAGRRRSAGSSTPSGALGPSRSTSVIISMPPPTIPDRTVSAEASHPPTPPRQPPQPQPSLSLPCENIDVGASRVHCHIMEPKGS